VRDAAGGAFEEHALRVLIQKLLGDARSQLERTRFAERAFHHGSAPRAITTTSSGKSRHTRSRWIGFWHTAGAGGPGMPVLIVSGRPSSMHLA
jgi:hypothetical protein